MQWIKKIKLKKTEKATSEKQRLEARREEVLAKGRKFKYPLQYAKHRLVLWTLVMGAVALVAMIGVMWFLLFKTQSTGESLYRLTKFFPITVAKVDGEKLRYSDYLMIYKSSIMPVEQQGQFSSKEEEQTIKERYKRLAMDMAESYAYALKLGRELGVKIEKEAIDRAQDRHRKVGGVERSEEIFWKIVKENFDLEKDEYRRILELSLMKAEVAKRIDEEAKKVVEEVERELKESQDLSKIGEKLKDKVHFERTGVLVDAKTIDGGRVQKAMELEVGKISEIFMSSNGDAYFVVKVVEKKDSGVSYESLKVELLEFNKRMKQIREEGKIQEFIELK